MAKDVNPSVSGVKRNEEQYETVAASQSDQALGATGGIGDVLKRLICVVDTNDATSALSIKDGSGSAISIIPGSAPIGVHVVELDLQSVAGAWSVTTGAGVTAIAIGRFT